MRLGAKFQAADRPGGGGEIRRGLRMVDVGQTDRAKHE
jgi:hypothetical protein